MKDFWKINMRQIMFVAFGACYARHVPDITCMPFDALHHIIPCRKNDDDDDILYSHRSTQKNRHFQKRCKRFLRNCVLNVI